MTSQDAVAFNLNNDCPESILNSQKVVRVLYYSFDNLIHAGQIVVNEIVIEDIKKIFEVILENKFPIAKVIPISNKKYYKNGNWDDELSMQDNNSSGFNYRKIIGTDNLSTHASGLAVDINPKINPYISPKLIQPQGAVYDPTKPGVLTKDCPVVKIFESLGWLWGAELIGKVDYHHFQKIRNK